ncbi:hypothetical protein ED733_000961 [Metarhizium rileyi]|uniref:Uncharacterized protein n=1 Tax=Metarhizium rileyi (strain RCEF 4871) TaxID=1649241 RepID=A0A5C6G6E1_METRR|nr:hypothetical protein ED733_000961 [Metarhizium rileyi]
MVRVKDIRVKDMISRLSEKYSWRYLERWFLRRCFSAEAKEPLLTGSPIDEDEANNPNDDTHLPPLPESISPLQATGRPGLPIFRPLRVRNPKQMSSDSQETKL